MSQPQPSSGEIRFARVALLTGRPAYWSTSPTDAFEHSVAVGKLLNWCLGLPGVRLGIDAGGIGHIVRSVYAQRGREPGVAVNGWLRGVGVSREQGVSWPTDVRRFGPHLSQLLRYVRQAQEMPGRYLWVGPDEARWWAEKTTNSLLEYGRLLYSGPRGQDLFLPLFARHRCKVFAPFDGSSLWEHLMALLEDISTERRRRFQSMLEGAGMNLGEDLDFSSHLYWTWDLANFAVSVRKLVYTPLLAIWSEWPDSRRWASSPEEPVERSPALSAVQAASLLENVLWKKVETLFAVVRMACGLGVAEPEFAGHEAHPPVFYSVTPFSPPLSPEGYLRQEGKKALYPLAKTCLGSDDPFAQEVAWGVLEGDLVTLRREAVTPGGCHSWYLLLPTASKPVPPGEVEVDLGQLANSLTFLEFSIAHEARDISTELDTLGTQQALWGGTLAAVSNQMAGATGLLPILGQPDLQSMYDEFRHLLIPLHRLQALMGRIGSDAERIQRKYQGYVDGTEDYLRRRLTFSLFPHPDLLSLREALLDAYPYHYLRQPLRSLRNQTSFLLSSIERICDTINAWLGEADRLVRKRQEGWTRRLSFLVGLLALLVALPQFIPGSVLEKETYPVWLDRYMPLALLETGVRYLAGGVVLGLSVASVVYVLVWLYHRIPRHPERFIAQIQRFWALADRAKAYAAWSLLAGQSSEMQDTPSVALTAFKRHTSLNTALSSHQLSEILQSTANDAWKELERMDREALRLLAVLWDEITLQGTNGPTHGLGSLQRLWNWLQQRFRSAQAINWLRQTQHLRYLVYLFDLCPDIIPLPRTLCVFRYRSGDFHSGATVVPDWDFQRSLRAIGFETREIQRLEAWLSEPANRETIQQMDVRDFARALKQRGVTANPWARTPEKWHGLVDAA